VLRDNERLRDSIVMTITGGTGRRGARVIRTTTEEDRVRRTGIRREEPTARARRKNAKWDGFLVCQLRASAFFKGTALSRLSTRITLGRLFITRLFISSQRGVENRWRRARSLDKETSPSRSRIFRFVSKLSFKGR